MINRVLVLLVVLLGMAGCGLQSGGYVSSQKASVTRSYSLQDITFSAPEDIRISESNNFYPVTDVVWRGDPKGPRIPQIEAMFRTAAERNKPVLLGDVPVIVDIELVRFHGVTDRTRYAMGGVYNIIFIMTVRDARTGEVIEPARRVLANLDAPGGREAVALETSGQTQKVRVTNFLSAVLRSELQSS